MNMGKILYEGQVPSSVEEGMHDAPLSPEHLESMGLPSSVRMLRELPAKVFEINVPKSEDGTLRLKWRTAIEDDHEALVLHEFLPDCAAASLDKLQVGDELLSANDYETSVLANRKCPAPPSA